MLSPLRYVCLNDDKETFTCIFPTRYDIFSCIPFKIHFSKDFSDISLGLGATCNGYRFIAVSGLPADPIFDTKSVCVFDHSLSNPEIFRDSFSQHILSLKLTPNLLICAFYDHLEIWNMESHQKIHNISSAINVHAPCDISNDFRYLATSGLSNLDLNLCSFLDFNSKQIHAADNPISLVKFSKKDRLLATTSSAGHVVKVWNPENGECYAKFRRGNTASVIHSIDFSPDNNYLAIFSQNGTLHFFDIKKPNNSTVRSIHRISLENLTSCLIAWITNNKIALLSMDGKMILLTIDESNCHEIGRENIHFLNKIIESHPE